MCWSPKGKQIVLGTSSGELVQYNQKLDIKKTIRSPDFTTEQVKGKMFTYFVSFILLVKLRTLRKANLITVLAKNQMESRQGIKF